MKKSVLFSAAIILTISVSTWAVFDPDTDANLTFNLNFENNVDYSTIDAKSNLVGNAEDYNSLSFDMWRSVNGIRGTYADFNQFNDFGSGAGESNDCSISIAPNGPIFEFGDGWPGNEHTTFTFWFKMPTTSAGSFIRHTYLYDTAIYWEIRAYNGKLGFSHFYENSLRFETADTLTSLGVANNTWHHAVIVVDRTNCWINSIPTTGQSCKIFIDGSEVPIVVSYLKANNINIDTYLYYDSPLAVGSGERNFDGQMDEIRIYNRILSPMEVSLLYQNNPSVPHTMALQPVPKATDVSIMTDVNWVPATGATAQTLYFGTDSNSLNLPSVMSGDSGLNRVTNTQLGGPLNFLTKYYWYVKSTVGGVDISSTVWSFTTGSQEATLISPLNGQEGVIDENIDLKWSAPDATSFDVYFSIHKELVEAGDASVRIATGITDSNYLIVDANKGETYYWKVNSIYPPSTLAEGDIWQFRTEARLIVVNTSDVNVMLHSVDYPALSMTKDEDLLTTVTGYLGDDDTVIFEFATDPNFTRLYDMVVIPEIDSVLEAQYDAAGHRRTSRPFAIHVNGDMNLKCHIAASGLDAEPRQNDSSSGRAGGHRGSYRTEDRASMSEADMLEIFGPGLGETSVSYSCGSGGGYGGQGGDNGRISGGGGKTYGYQEIPVLLGGSAGGWSNNAQGGPGGGAVEIAATGNITLASTSKIMVTGGQGPSVDYGSGGGSGGSLKIIAGGAFINNGVIDANGGKGSDTLRAGKLTDAGGGGGGGRIAVYYGTTYSNDNGTIKAQGGAVGNTDGQPSTSSQPGDAGTIFSSNANTLIPELPTPSNGSDAVVLNDEVTLKWYPGFGATQNKVYFGTSSDPGSMALLTTINGDPAKGGVLRAEQTMQVDVVAGQTYYWYVKAAKGVTEIDSDVWTFVAVNDFKLVFNTSDVNTVTFDGQSIAPLTCRVKNATGWVASPVVTGAKDANLAVFNFTSGFNYNSNYTITVLPEYTTAYDNKLKMPLAIHATGNFYFDGKIDISGDDSTGTNIPMGRSGGHRGVRFGRGGGTDVAAGHYVAYTRNPWGEYRFGNDTGNRTFYTTAASVIDVFGAGLPKSATAMPTGGGGGYGGLGGDSGRGFWYGAFGGGSTYGDKEIPLPFGGSSGGLSDTIASGAGGGGIEIVATGNVTFGPNAEIISEGGSVTIASGKGGGAGSGGSIKIIAGGTFSNSGVISVNGGQGGDTNAQLNQIAGGGAGGRVSIFYASGTPVLGTITANGGSAGILTTTGSDGYAEDGQDGTIFVSSGSPKKASTPTPRNGATVYAGSSPVTLKWYSGYNAGTDEVYFGTNPSSLVKIGSSVSATRREHSGAAQTVTAGQTYYWKVVTDSSVNSDVWSFKVVNWQCPEPWYDGLVWDKGPYYDCYVNLEEYIDLAENWGDGIGLSALSVFANEWLTNIQTP